MVLGERERDEDRLNNQNWGFVKEPTATIPSNRDQQEGDLNPDLNPPSQRLGSSQAALSICRCQKRGGRSPHSRSPADDHREDDWEPPELEDLHAGWVLLDNEDPEGDQGREADTDQRCQVSIIWEERGGCVCARAQSPGVWGTMMRGGLGAEEALLSPAA